MFHWTLQNHFKTSGKLWCLHMNGCYKTGSTKHNCNCISHTVLHDGHELLVDHAFEYNTKLNCIVNYNSSLKHFCSCYILSLFQDIYLHQNNLINQHTSKEFVLYIYILFCQTVIFTCLVKVCFYWIYVPWCEWTVSLLHASFQ